MGKYKFWVGQQVRVKDNAFIGSDDPADFETRGQVGEVVNMPNRQSYGYYEIELESKFILLKPSELEAA